ncbi:MAG: LysR family transcriptional regulator, partial [Pseudomonadota bacterium]
MLSSLSDADLKLLRVFHTIVTCGGVSRAQPELNSSQSTISTQLSHLETRLGFRLCNRGRRGFSLTERGRVVFEEAKILFAAVDDFRVRVAETATSLEGELRLGLIEAMITLPDLRFAEAVDLFRARSSRATIDLRVESVVSLESMVLEGRLHLAIGVCHHRLPSLQYEKVLTEEHYLYCGAKHPLFHEEQPAQIMQGIAATDYVSRIYFENSLTKPDLPLRPAAQSDNIEGLAMLILSGQYIAYLPDHYAKTWVKTGEMKPLLPDQIRHDAEFHLIRSKGGRLP